MSADVQSDLVKMSVDVQSDMFKSVPMSKMSFEAEYGSLIWTPPKLNHISSEIPLSALVYQILTSKKGNPCAYSD